MGCFQFQPSKHHMSAYQIQRELEKIDSKLTELELKGRGLEDAIRNGKSNKQETLVIVLIWSSDYYTSLTLA